MALPPFLHLWDVSGHLAMRSITIPASALWRVLPAKLVTLATCNTMECQLYCDPHLGGDNLCICLLIISNISLKCESSSLFGMIKYQRWDLLNIKCDLCAPGMVELVDDAGRQVVLPLGDHRDVQHGVVGPRLQAEYSVLVNTGFNIHTSI